MALMILNLQFQPCLYSQQSPRTAPSRATTTTRATCSASASASAAFSVETISSNCDARRTANYHPNIWDFEFIQSLKTEYTGDMYVGHAKLKEIVRSLFGAQDMGCLGLLELIDVLQKVGIGYHFEKEICISLDVIDTYNNNTFQIDEDLHAVSLRFRLLRQHGYYISQDVFARFKDENGAFDVNLAGDFKGLLSLYEASHLAVEGEDILDEARTFASKHLQKIRTRKQVSRSLELPLHWRIKRLDTRWYLEDGLSTDNHINSDIHELAKLDFNMVQRIHQNELREMSRWWRDLGLGSHEQLSFARDRLMENYLWTIGGHFYPQNSYCRKGLTKVNSLITTIDDVYDVYGSLEELELFTDAVERWDLNAIEQLPYYMKICFLALHNTVNEIAYVTLAEHGLDITRFLKKSWTDLCKSYLVEAKWYYNKYTPTLEEYLNNAWISISGPVILVHAYVFLKQELTEEALKYLGSYPDIVRCSSMILRLCNDLGTSTAEIERGDVPKSVQCYMKQTGSSEESARIHIRHLISETWKKMNKSRVDVSLFPKPFFRTAVDLARMAHCMYQYGDGHGIQNQETKDRVMALLVKPIALSEFTTN